MKVRAMADEESNVEKPETDEEKPIIGSAKVHKGFGKMC